MPRFAPMKAGLNAFAEDAVWHMQGFAQGVLDLAVIVALGMAVYATGIGHDLAATGATQGEVMQAGMAAAVTACDAEIDAGEGECITAMTLKPQNG